MRPQTANDNNTYVLINYVPNFTVQSPSWETNSPLVGQETI
jgi:hypothetical protein